MYPQRTGSSAQVASWQKKQQQIDSKEFQFSERKFLEYGLFTKSFNKMIS